MNILKTLAITMMALFGLGCTPGQKLKTVKELDIKKYAGKWYEIAKLPNRFEQGLTCVTAEYVPMQDGSIKVINSGLKTDGSNKRKRIEGSAKVPDKNKPGELKVTFFWPFYGDYFVFELGKEYQYALVGSPSRKYFWILGREKVMDETQYQTLLSIARDYGFDISAVEKMDQSCP